MTDTLETEVKLDASPEFTVPPLDGAVAGLVAETVTERSLEAVYHDAPDLRLVRAGITLRHRRGEGGVDGTWTLKLPDDGRVPAGALARREITIAGPPGEPPAELVALVRAHLRTAELSPVALLRTVRRSTSLSIGGGVDAAVVGSIDDDDVTVVEDGKVVARFREVEAEVAEHASDELLPALVARLRGAGAGVADPTPKLVRALGPRALQPPAVTPIVIHPGADAAEVLQAALANAVVRIVDHDRVIRADVDPEGIHQARVGSRRLRSDLRTFAPLLDVAWAEPLRDELEWFAGELGTVRDRDVLRSRLRKQLKELSAADRPAGDALIARLGAERDAALASVIDVLDSRRYLELLDRLVDAASAPHTRPAAEGAAAGLLPRLVAKPWRTLRKAVERLGPDPADEALHRVRILAKRARYASDVAVPVVGDPARRFSKAIAAVQDVLGDHNDCAVAADWLRATATTATPAEVLVIGQLIRVQEEEAARLRNAWHAAWQAIDLTAWLR